MSEELEETDAKALGTMYAGLVSLLASSLNTRASGTTNLVDAISRDSLSLSYELEAVMELVQNRKASLPSLSFPPVLGGGLVRRKTLAPVFIPLRIQISAEFFNKSLCERLTGSPCFYLSNMFSHTC